MSHSCLIHILRCDMEWTSKLDWVALWNEMITQSPEASFPWSMILLFFFLNLFHKSYLTHRLPPHLWITPVNHLCLIPSIYPMFLPMWHNSRHILLQSVEMIQHIFPWNLVSSLTFPMLYLLTNFQFLFYSKNSFPTWIISMPTKVYLILPMSSKV